jgi:hypothetical protein
MSNWPSGRMDQMSGAELQRSFLMSMWEYEQYKHTNLRPHQEVVELSDSKVEELSRNILVMASNLERLADMVSLELGIPIN